MEIDKDAKIIEWLNNIDAKENTRIGYLQFLKLYCQCADKTPTDLIQESIKEIKQGLLPAERNVGGYISKYKACMREKNYSANSLHIGISAIRSFYKAFDIPLPNSVIKTKKPLPLKENNIFLPKEDIKNLLTNAKNLREKAIILCMATSGMARNEIINLKVKDIVFDSDNIGTVTVRREKEQVDYTTFLSPEATQALKAYWKERNRIALKKENITLEELKKAKVSHAKKVLPLRKQAAKKLEIAPESYAFTTYETGEKLSPPHFITIFRNMGKELGYDNGNGFIKSRSHALRKYFATTLENAGMPKNKVDFMLGHTPNQRDSAYFKIDPVKLKKLYKTFLPYLTFEKEIKIHAPDTEEIKALYSENRELKDRLEQIENKMLGIMQALDNGNVIPAGSFKAVIKKEGLE